MNKFIGYVEGYICTTNVDSHGDKLTPEAIESIKDQIERDPTLRTMYLQHEVSQPCGEILELRIDTKSEWKGLWAKVGIYKNRKDVLGMIENKELTGFSIAGRVLEEQKLEVCSEKDLIYKFDLEVDPQYWGEIKDILDKKGIQSEVYVRKALDIPVIISVAANGLFIIDKLYDYWKNRKKQGVNINIKIVIEDKKFDFNQVVPEDIETFFNERKLTTLSKLYIFSDRNSKTEAIQFIKDHPFLFSVLIEAPRHIFSIFGNNIRLYLELHRDPEEDFEGLFIIIKTKRSPKESLNLLDRLDEEWWLNVDDNVSNMLEIMVRPI